MKVCAVSLKECWREADGRWHSTGGFPAQMAGIRSLFDEMDLVVVESFRRSGGTALPEAAQVTPLRPLPGEGLRRKLAVLRRLPYYWTTIAGRVRKSDVVHVPMPGDIPLVAMFVALVARKPLLVRYGGSWELTGITTFMNRFTRACLRRFAGGRNVMLVTGDGAGAPSARMHWIFSTALSRRELAAITCDLNRGLSSPPRLVYAGRLSVEKGVGHLLHALAGLKSNAFNIRPTLWIAGDGPERRNLEVLATKLGCATHVNFCGQLSRRELSELLAQSDVCVQPSLSEGFSKAWLDAMAHGLPVIGSAMGAAKAVIGGDGERGWLVRPGDEQDLASTLRRVLHGPVDWPALRARCRAYTEGRTLEAWSEEIGRICAAQWRCSFAGGKLSQ